MANTSDYIAAGRAGAKGVRDSFIAARQNAPDYQTIGEARQNATASKKKAAIQATKGVITEGIRAKAKVENTKTKIEADEKILDTKLGAKRFAGIVGGLGTVAVAGMSMAAPKEDTSSWKDKHYAAQEALQKEMLARLQKEDDADGEVPGIQELPTYEPTPFEDDGGGSSKSSDSKSSGNLKMDYMSKLTKAGMSDEQAAATVGHLMVETGGFKHMEELAPNAYGTKGYGHLQWTDTGSGGGRRTDFMNYSKKQGLDPQSFEANSGFLVKELTTNFNNSWTNGGSFEGLQGIQNLEDASSYLQTNFIRPGVPHTDRRLAEGRKALDEWRNR